MSDGVRALRDALLELLLPVGCGGCGTPGSAWCRDCARLLGAPVRVYPPCCRADIPVHALGAYQGRLRVALLAYKERGRRDLAVPLGGALAAALRTLAPGSGGLYLVPVPSRWSAAARRGGQHVSLLADRAAAALAGAGMAAAVAPALRMAPGVRDSVGLDLAHRQANLRGRVLLRPAGLPPPGAHAVLVDDVITTGSTAATCGAVLLQAGIKLHSIVAIAAAGCHPTS